MPKLLEALAGNELAFPCPGCGNYHSFCIKRESNEAGPLWQWNGSLDKPTFSPSLLVGQGTKSQCHLFVTDGRIIYLSDCWHDLRGQTIDMKDIKTDW